MEAKPGVMSFHCEHQVRHGARGLYHFAFDVVGFAPDDDHRQDENHDRENERGFDQRDAVFVAQELPGPSGRGAARRGRALPREPRGEGHHDGSTEKT